MKDIVADSKLIAYCGLYCAACRKYLAGKCSGCMDNEKATWCKVRACCIEHNYFSCADCTIVDSVADCKKFNNFMAKIFAFVFRSNRGACIQLIKEKGREPYAADMAKNRIMTIKR